MNDMKSREIFTGVLFVILVFTIICPGNLRAGKEGTQVLIKKGDGQVIEGELIRIDESSILLKKVPDTKVKIGISEIEKIVIKEKPGSSKEDRIGAAGKVDYQTFRLKGKSPSEITRIMKKLKSTTIGRASDEKIDEIKTNTLKAKKIITKKLVAANSDVRKPGAKKTESDNVGTKRAEIEGLKIKKAQIDKIEANEISTNDLNVIGTDTIFSKLRVKKLLIGENTMHFGGSLTDPGNHIYTDDSSLFIQSEDKNFDTIINANNIGKVGIGTTIPETKLHIKGGSCLNCPTIPGMPEDLSGRTVMRFQDKVIDANNNVIANVNWDLFAIGSSFSFRTFEKNDSPETIMTLRPEKKVGIGTRNPKGQIHINGPDGIIIERRLYPYPFIGTQSKIFMDNSQGMEGLSFLMSPNHGIHWIDTLFLSESGDMGIGTNSPGAKLEIVDNTDYNGVNNQTTLLKLKNVINNGDINNSTTADLDFYMWDADTQTGHPQARIGIIGTSVAGLPQDAGGRLVFYTAKQVYPGNDTSLVERMRIDPYGNIGLGTGSPEFKLHLYGRNDQVIKMESLIGSTGDISVLKIGAISSGGSKDAQIQYNGKFRFVNPIPGSGSSGTRLIIDTNGNVGIGTLDPESKLHVNKGDIRITKGINTLKFTASNGAAPTGDDPSVEIGSSNGVITFIYGSNYNKLVCKALWAKEEIYVQSLNPWSDFVFDKSYKLKSLDEVEAYIRENNHLPDVPTAEEVKENGVSLGKMDALLLQKVEELTLYMIELKKENEQMKKEIEELKKKN